MYSKWRPIRYLTVSNPPQFMASLRASLIHRVYCFIVNRRVVFYSTIAALAILLGAITIGVIVAQFSPSGYSIIRNYISDLGSTKYTVAPLFLDLGAMISAPLFIPATLYLEQALAPLPQNAGDLLTVSRPRMRLASIGYFWMCLGLIGLFGIGLFSEDRSGPLHLHSYFSLLVFGSLIFSSISYGLLIIAFPTPLRKILGWYMIFGPVTLGALYFSRLYPSRQFYEWMLFASIFTWVLPCAFQLLKQIHREYCS